MKLPNFFKKNTQKKTFKQTILESAGILLLVFAVRTFIFGLYTVPTGSMEATMLVGERFVADKLSYWMRKPQRGEIICMNNPMYKYSENPILNFWERYCSWNVENLTKRVIGIPGDRIQGIIEDGKTVIYVNGTKLDESNYLNKHPLILVNSYSFRHHDSRPITKTFHPDFTFDKQPYYKIDSSNILLNDEGKPYLLWPYTPQDFDTFDITLGENQYWCMGDNRCGSLDCRSFGIVDGSLIHGRIVFRFLSVDTDESWLILDILKNPVHFFKKLRLDRCMQLV